MNFEKSSMVCSANISDQKKKEIENWLGVKMGQDPGMYLGTPSTWGKTRTETLAYIRDRVMAKLKYWKQ